MANQDDNNQEIEKVEDVEVETTKKTSNSDDKTSGECCREDDRTSEPHLCLQ